VKSFKMPQREARSIAARGGNAPRVRTSNED
jgi:hypothetical protein